MTHQLAGKRVLIVQIEAHLLFGGLRPPCGLGSKKDGPDHVRQGEGTPSQAKSNTLHCVAARW
jgi:hypothetical protein